MIDPERFSAGFYEHLEPTDDWAAKLFEKYKLSPAPTFAELEPIAVTLWKAPETKLEATELVLGRHVEMSELSDYPALRNVYSKQDAQQAVSLLRTVRDIDQLRIHE